jgi:hypothetical protein
MVDGFADRCAALPAALSTLSGHLTTNRQRAFLPIGLANVFHEASQHTADFDDFSLAERELAPRNDRRMNQFPAPIGHAVVV